jgi:hypothetical protein
VDRFVNQDGMDFQDRTVQIDLVFTAGTSGAVPSSFIYSNGISGITLSGSNYTVALQDSYVALLGTPPGTVIQASYSASGATTAKVSAQNVTSGTAPTVTITCYEANGTATAMATGDTLYITIRLKR